jgi:hypothetical protein
MKKVSPGLMARKRKVAIFALISSAVAATPASAQDIRLEVMVDQIAGTSIYLRAGTADGIAQDDTLTVFNESGDQAVGALLVISATASRSVVSFLADPFPVTRGTLLRIRIGSSPSAAERAQEPGVDPVRTTESPPSAYPQVRGRLSLQLNTLASTTSWSGNEDVSIDRRFTTPAIGLRFGVKDLPGGLELASNLRGTYRHSSNDLVQPAHSMRVYEASVRKSFERAPLQVQLGRFYNRYETYSGYWDGLLLRYGTRGLGAGVAVGYEPDRANEGVSTDLPKYTTFVDFNHVGDQVGYFTDISFHQQLPGNDVATETFFGWSQQLTMGRTRLGTNLQVHRDPGGNSWSVTRLHTNGSVPLTSRVSLLGRYAFDRPEYRFRFTQLFSFERRQAGVGFRYWGRGGNASLYVTTNRVNQGDLSYSVSSSFRVTRTQVLELGFHGAGTVWMLENTRVINLLAGIDRVFGRVQSRASYRLYRTVGANSTLLSHTVDAALVFPIGRRVFSTINARVQQGTNQTSNSLFVSLWTSF